MRSVVRPLSLAVHLSPTPYWQLPYNDTSGGAKIYWAGSHSRPSLGEGTKSGSVDDDNPSSTLYVEQRGDICQIGEPGVGRMDCPMCMCGRRKMKCLWCINKPRHFLGSKLRNKKPLCGGHSLVYPDNHEIVSSCTPHFPSDHQVPVVALLFNNFTTHCT